MNLRKTEHHGWLSTRSHRMYTGLGLLKTPGLTLSIRQVLFSMNGDGKAAEVHVVRKREGMIYVKDPYSGDVELPKWIDIE